MPTVEDGKLLRDLIQDTDALYWDTQNEVLIFRERGSVVVRKGFSEYGKLSGVTAGSPYSASCRELVFSETEFFALRHFRRPNLLFRRWRHFHAMFPVERH